MFTLQSKIPTAYACGYPTPDGFVEPEPELFRFLAKSADTLKRMVGKSMERETRELLAEQIAKWRLTIETWRESGEKAARQEASLQIKNAFSNYNSFRDVRIVQWKLSEFRKLMLKVAEEAEAERKGKTVKSGSIESPAYLPGNGLNNNILFSDPIRNYGKILQRIHGYPLSDRDFEDDMTKVTVVCRYQIPCTLLQAAIGRANRIYVLFPWKGELIPCIGGVLSYREFIRPIREKMDDAQWRKEAEVMTGRPPWNKSFIAEPLSKSDLLKIAQEPEVKQKFLEKE